MQRNVAERENGTGSGPAAIDGDRPSGGERLQRAAVPPQQPPVEPSGGSKPVPDDDDGITTPSGGITTPCGGTSVPDDAQFIESRGAALARSKPPAAALASHAEPDHSGGSKPVPDDGTGSAPTSLPHRDAEERSGKEARPWRSQF